MRLLVSILTALLVVASSARGEERDEVNVVGSPAVAPFSLGVASMLAKDINMNVKQAATGAAFAALCREESDVDIATVARPVNARELALCAANGSEDLVELQLGVDGLVLAQAAKARDMSLSARDVYQALARRTPRSDNDCVMVVNRRDTWKQVRPDLPSRPIEVFGPPGTSGTRDLLAAAVLAEGARSYRCLADREQSHPGSFAEALELRRDGAWVDGGDNDHAIAHTLQHVQHAVGILGFAHMKDQAGVKAVAYNGVLPSRITIANGSYVLRRPLLLYVRAERLAARPVIEKTLGRYTSWEAVNPGGFLPNLGLITSGATGTRTNINTATGDRTVIYQPEMPEMSESEAAILPESIEMFTAPPPPPEQVAVKLIPELGEQRGTPAAQGDADIPPAKGCETHGVCEPEEVEGPKPLMRSIFE